jgi:hypothetical protein
MLDHTLQSYIESQNLAYLLAAKQHAEETASRSVEETERLLAEHKQQIRKDTFIVLEEIKHHIGEVLAGYVKTPNLDSPTLDQEYPIGSIISVAVVCSDTEAELPFLDNGPIVNTTINNIYLNTKDSKTGQAFHWFDGMATQTPGFELMPGVWRARGVCGGFKNQIVGFKYYLAQRVK